MSIIGVTYGSTGEVDWHKDRSIIQKPANIDIGSQKLLAL